MKNCRRCGESKALESFTVSKASKDGRSSYCRPCMRAYAREYRYGMSKQQYDAMMESQGYACAVCRAVFTDEVRPTVDHDHNCCPSNVTCGLCVRGILCSGCNAFAGIVETRFKYQEAMFTYLRLHLESKINRLALGQTKTEEV